ncbi:MAG: hypothetical protein Q9160_002499 [Pyrenula sp. 1 TL-2023]
METRRQLQRQQEANSQQEGRPQREGSSQRVHSNRSTGQPRLLTRTAPAANDMYGGVNTRPQGIQPGGEGGKMLRLNRAHAAFGASKNREAEQQQQAFAGRGGRRGNRARGNMRRRGPGQGQSATESAEDAQFKRLYKEFFPWAADEASDQQQDADEFLPSPDEMTYFLGDPPLQREPVPYTPEPVTVDSLRQDWPAFPSSPLALSEGVEEKLRWLSRRIAHSHPTTMELARRLFKGELVHFQSAEERKEVEKLAGDMAAERAQTLNERANATETHEPVAVGFQPLAESDRGQLARKIVRGEYVEPLVEGNSEVMERIAVNLRNNGTYGEGDTEKFFGKLREVIGGGSQRARAPRVAAT